MYGNGIQFLYQNQQVRTAVEALLTRASKAKENSLFPDAPTRLLMDVTTHKIPDGANHFFNITLPSSPNPPESEILLIIPDDLKSKVDPDIVVNSMKDRLREAGLKIREVMTLKQCKDEYGTFEAKRALAKRIEIVVGDISIFKCLSSILGREFIRKKKFALGVDLEKEKDNLKDAFDYILKKTVLNISTKGPTTSLVVGFPIHCCLTKLNLCPPDAKNSVNSECPTFVTCHIFEKTVP